MARRSDYHDIVSVLEQVVVRVMVCVVWWCVCERRWWSVVLVY